MWKAELARPGHVHLVPVDDVVAHTLEEDCVCVPGPEYIPAEDDQAPGWLYTHFSLDGREWRKKADKP